MRGKDKLGVPASEPVRVVLECDGTQIEDGEYFRTLANNTVLLLLRQGERWYPTGVDVIKAGECSSCLYIDQILELIVQRCFPCSHISYTENRL